MKSCTTKFKKCGPACCILSRWEFMCHFPTVECLPAKFYCQGAGQPEAHCRWRFGTQMSESQLWWSRNRGKYSLIPMWQCLKTWSPRPSSGSLFPFIFLDQTRSHSFDPQPCGNGYIIRQVTCVFVGWWWWFM